MKPHAKALPMLITLVVILLSLQTFTAKAESSSLLYFDKDEYTGLQDKITITYIAPEYNKSSRAREFISAKVATTENPAGYDVILREANADTSEFAVMINLSNTTYDKNSSTIKVTKGTRISIKCDNYTAYATWKPNDATLSFDKVVYFGIGSRPIITVKDPDLNINPIIKEEISVNVSSTSNPAGLPVKLIETGSDTGTFSAAIDLTTKSDNTAILKVNQNDTLTVAHTDSLTNDGSVHNLKATATWKPDTAELSLSSSEAKGLGSLIRITVADNDSNIQNNRADYTFVRVTSDKDPIGISVKLNETGLNTGTFTNTLRFTNQNSSQQDNSIKVATKSTVNVSYTDEWASNNAKYIKISKTISFQYSEAVIGFTTDRPEGFANSLYYGLGDQDANRTSSQEYVTLKVTSTSNATPLILTPLETSGNSGSFEGRIYFSETKHIKDEDKDDTIFVQQGDNITFSYIDNTTPDGTTKVIEKTAIWSYSMADISLDKDNYTGYNSVVTVTIKDSEANKALNSRDTLRVGVFSASSSGFTMDIDETGLDTGVFSGSFTLVKTNSKKTSQLYVQSGDKITVKYSDQGKVNAGVVYDYADFVASNGNISLDKSSYVGSNAAAIITVTDWDEAISPSSKDKIRIDIIIDGSTIKNIELVETGNHTGTFTGTLNINNNINPAISLKEGQKFEVYYKDNSTTSRSWADCKASATWTSK